MLILVTLNLKRPSLGFAIAILLGVLALIVLVHVLNDLLTRHPLTDCLILLFELRLPFILVSLLARYDH